MNTITLMKRFFPYFKKYKGILALDLLCASLTTLCEIVLPLIVREITSRAINNLAQLTVSLILRLGALYFLLRIIDAMANYYMANTGHMMGAKIETDMRTDLFSHLQELSFSYFSNMKVGQIMARITSDLFEITEFDHHGPEELFIASIKIIASFIILAGMNIYLTIIMFASIPIMVVVSVYFNRKMRAAFKMSRQQIGEINSQVEDSLLGVRVVKSFANEDIEKEKFGKGNSKFLDIKKISYRYMAGFQTSTRVFDGVMYVVVIVVGALFLVSGSITPADYTAYLLYVATLIAAIRRIVEFTEQFQRGMTGIERFCEIMDAPVEIEDTENARELKNVKGEIVLENIKFSYSDGNNEVLSGINLKVLEGQNIALVGPSGGGKTTLVNLIPRFYDVTEGRILLDGIDVREYTQKSLRENIGVVQQDVYLFSGTIYDNIVYGMPGATLDKVMQAAKDAGCHDFIMGLPKGYDTYVGERGVKLSGGQKQRISIARVFLKNPPVLILDEATSALDNESEMIVKKSLERLAYGRTTFTIAHRLTTIRNADKILVLTEKGIEECGTHDELIKKDGIYKSLYKLYEN
ncbi:MAG: ABC transporter ATP-binding protein [Bacillota bacterium]|nr:ABC transporter ATP-binding protein [Bacillota bacterium]